MTGERSRPLWLFGDQLGRHFHSTRHTSDRPVLLIESTHALTDRPRHRQKVHLVLAALRQAAGDLGERATLIFDPSVRVGPDACPFTAGCWAWMGRNEGALQGNHRSRQPLATMRRPADLDAVVEQEVRREPWTGERVLRRRRPLWVVEGDGGRVGDGWGCNAPRPAFLPAPVFLL